MIVGILGPLLFVRPWVKAFGKWIAGQPWLAEILTRARGLHLGKLPIGRLIFNYWVAWVLGLLVVLAIMLTLARFMPLLMVLFFGPAVGILLVANALELDDALPGLLHLPHLDSWRVLGFIGLILVVFLLALGAEVLLLGPDLRADGLHGILAPRLLGFRAIPVMIYDLEEDREPQGALYVGGSKIHVLYDPCTESVRLVPVGGVRLQLIDRVDCRSM
jgi:hypothetical protein